MAESTLSIEYDVLRRWVGRKLAYDRTPGNWSAAQILDCNDAIRSGLRRFYTAYDWKFLRNSMTLDLEGGTWRYQMPDDYGGAIGQLTYNDTSTSYPPIEQTSVSDIDALRQRSTTSGRPRLFAESPINNIAAVGQRFELLVFPTPESSYPVTARYFALQSMLTSDRPYPLGGGAHAETILFSCLSSAEAMIFDTEEVYSKKYEDALAKSIAHENNLRGAKTLGPDYDGSDGSEVSDGAIPSRWFGGSSYQTYEGHTLYEGG